MGDHYLDYTDDLRREATDFIDGLLLHPHGHVRSISQMIMEGNIEAWEVFRLARQYFNFDAYEYLKTRNQPNTAVEHTIVHPSGTTRLIRSHDYNEWSSVMFKFTHPLYGFRNALQAEIDISYVASQNSPNRDEIRSNIDALRNVARTVITALYNAVGVRSTPHDFLNLHHDED